MEGVCSSTSDVKGIAAFPKSAVIATVKPGGVVVWGCLAASADCYQKLPEDPVPPSVGDLQLKRAQVPPQCTSRSTSEWLKKKQMKILEGPSQTPDLNRIKMLGP